jgi:hypothetical protein
VRRTDLLLLLDGESDEQVLASADQRRGSSAVPQLS